MHKYFVKKAEKITPSTLLLTLHRASDSSGLFSFQPGQYAAISFKRHKRPTPARCFSIVSSPTEQGILQFSMRTRGRFTKALSGLGEGDEVLVRGPFGGFVFDQLRDGQAVFLAGGIGITPFISMVRYASMLNLDNQITLLYSCQSQDDVPFFDELNQCVAKNPKLRVIYVISQGLTNKFKNNEFYSGNITPEIIDHVTGNKYDNKTFFMCGPPPFMNAMLKTLKSRGVPKSNLITEAFSQGANKQTGKVISWPVNMYILSAFGVAVAGFVIMINDLFTALPPSSLLDSNSINRTKILTNNRQTDLDKLVNELPEKTTDAPFTYKVNKALEDYQKSLEQSQAQAQPSAQTKIIKNITQKPAATTPTQTSAPQPKCTTTQSGVTTCI